MNLKFHRLHPDAVLPAYSREGDACMDLHCVEQTVIHIGEQVMVRTGLAIEIPPGYEGRIRGRSGIASKEIWTFHGTIDSNYRGEIRVIVRNSSSCVVYGLAKGDRIAQLSVGPVSYWMPEWAEELSSTERGAAGFGSSGL